MPLDFTGDPALGIALEFHRNQLFHAKSLGNRARHKFIGGGDDHHLVTGQLVLANQRQGLCFVMAFCTTSAMKRA